MNASTNRNLFFAAVVGGLISYGANCLLADDSDQHQKIGTLENRVKELQALLARTQQDLNNAQLLLQHPGTGNINADVKAPAGSKQGKVGAQAATDVVTNNVQLVRNLEISPENDSRSFLEKVNDLLSDGPTKEKIAVVSKGIFDLARDREHLPDDALLTIYNNQSDPDLKRVVAQVLSQRGNDTLLDDQVTKAQEMLKSAHPRDRQDALDQLAKIRSAKAADVIVPLLRDPDTDVKLDALLALRNNGNALHVGFVEMMRNDPSPAVRSLANDVASDLKDLSGSARTSMTSSSIEAGLPPM